MYILYIRKEMKGRKVAEKALPLRYSGESRNPGFVFLDSGLRTAGVTMSLSLAFFYFSLFLSLSVPCRAEIPQETGIADHVSAQAMDFLTALLGPGRARVTVSVSGEMRRTQNFTSIAVSPEAAKASDSTPKAAYLPGYGERLISGRVPIVPQGFTNYAQGPAPPSLAQTAQKQSPQEGGIHQSQEDSNFTEGFIVKKVLVSVILDSRVSEAKAKEVQNLLPKVLHLDTSRGDQLTLLRANLLPAWKLALQNFAASSKSAVTASFLLGALILTLLFGFIFYATAMRVVKTFVAELARARQAQNSYSPSQSGNLGIEAGKEQIPEILPGGIPGLSGEAAPLEGAATTVLSLGQRFDFLSSKLPSELADLLSAETPDDIALLLAALASSAPETAATIFSGLSSNKQREASQALMNITVADPEKLEALENKLRNIVEFGVRGPEKLGKILSRLPIDEREALVGGLSPQNPQATEELEKFLFSFEDIAVLKDADLRRVIMSSSYQEWGIALRGAPQNLIDAVLGLLPEGARSLAREGIESPQPRGKVLEARSRILSRTQALASKGEISLGDKNASEFI